MLPSTTWWLGRIYRDESDPDEVIELDVKGNRRGTTGTVAQLDAVLAAAFKLDDITKNTDWSICVGDKNGPETEVAYHSGAYPNVLFIRDSSRLDDLRGHEAVGIGKALLEVRPAPELLQLRWTKDPSHYPTRFLGSNGETIPGEMLNLDHFADSSYGNDMSASVVFSIGDTPYVLWVAAPRVFDRTGEQRAHGFHTYELQRLVRTRGDIEDDLADKQADADVLSTDDPVELSAQISRLYNEHATSVRSRAAAAGAAASPSRKLRNDFLKLPYHGWEFAAGTGKGDWITARHPHGDHLIWIEQSDDAPELYVTVYDDGDMRVPVADKKLPWPKIGRTAEGLLGLVRHTLDEWQPAPMPEDATSARFAQLETDKGPRKRAEDLEQDDSAQRFKLLELNPRRGNPPRTYRIQKVVSKLERGPAPSTPTRGALARSPEELVTETLAEYLAESSTEKFLVLHINVRNQIIGFTEYAAGAGAGVEVHPTGIFQDALGVGGAAIITAHNHPSGMADPSDDDRKLWARLREAGKLIGIPVLDNLVIGDGQFYSESEDELHQNVPSRAQLRAAAERSRR